MRGLQDPYFRAAGVDRRGYGGGAGPQLVVRLVLEAALRHGVEGDGEDQHQQRGRDEGHQRESAAQCAGCQAVETGSP